MPKSKKPAGGRPNFEPRYGEKKTPFHERTRSGGGQKPGSKSPSHRGYRATEEGASGAPKTRWTATQRAGRDEARGIRTHSQGDRPARSYDDRPPRSNDDRPRAVASTATTARPARTTIGRSVSTAATAPRARTATTVLRVRTMSVPPVASTATTVRPARSMIGRSAEYSSDRPARPYSNDRPARSNDERPARREYGNDRPARSFDDRPKRDYNSDRPRGTRPAGRSDWNATAPRTQAHEQHVDVVHERLQAEAIQATDVDGVSFGSLGLGDNIVRTLADLGAAAPFADPGRDDPRDSRGARRPRPRPHRLGQDHRLRRAPRRERAAGTEPASGANSAASPRRSSWPRPASSPCRSTGPSSRSPAASACSPRRSTAACRRLARSVR